MTAVLDRITGLPALPGIAARLIAMLDDENLQADEVHELVRQDEAISAAVVRMANSAAFGASGRTFNLQQALTRLGLRKLVRIAIQETTSATFSKGGEQYGMRRGTLWRCSLGGALAAEMIAKTTGKADAGTAFLCGLLRDIGKIAIELHPESDRLFIDAPQWTGINFLDEEERFLGFNHATIGAALALKWNLPDAIIGAIRSHHEPPPPGDPEHHALYDVVHAGDVVAMWAGFSDGADGMQYPLAQHVREEYFEARGLVEDYIAATNAAVYEAEVEFGLSSSREARA